MSLTSSYYQLTTTAVTSPIQTVQVIVNVVVMRGNSALAFSNRIYQTGLPFNVPIGTTVIRVNTSDIDFDQLVYSIESNYSFIASIDPMTGIVMTTECLPSGIQGSVITITVYVTEGELNE